MVETVLKSQAEFSRVTIQANHLGANSLLPRQSLAINCIKRACAAVDDWENELTYGLPLYPVPATIEAVVETREYLANGNCNNRGCGRD
jgi:hypothetical protein